MTPPHKQNYDQHIILIYILLPLCNLIKHYGLNYYCYADDTKIYIHTKPAHILSLYNLVCCLNAINNWMTQNFLNLIKIKLKPFSFPSITF